MHYNVFLLFYYLLSSFIMFLVCITNVPAVNTLEQSFFAGKSVYINFFIIIIIIVLWCAVTRDATEQRTGILIIVMLQRFCVCVC